jgi:hypothetical protein
MEITDQLTVNQIDHVLTDDRHRSCLLQIRIITYFRLKFDLGEQIVRKTVKNE